MRRSSATSLTVLLALGASLQLLPMASTVSASPRTTAPTGTQLEELKALRHTSSVPRRRSLAIPPS